MIRLPEITTAPSSTALVPVPSISTPLISANLSSPARAESYPTNRPAPVMLVNLRNLRLDIFLKLKLALFILMVIGSSLRLSSRLAFVPAAGKLKILSVTFCLKRVIYLTQLQTENYFAPFSVLFRFSTIRPQAKKRSRQALFFWFYGLIIGDDQFLPLGRRTYSCCAFYGCRFDIERPNVSYMSGWSLMLKMNLPFIFFSCLARSL